MVTVGLLGCGCLGCLEVCWIKDSGLTKADEIWMQLWAQSTHEISAAGGVWKSGSDGYLEVCWIKDSCLTKAGEIWVQLCAQSTRDICSSGAGGAEC